MSNVLSSDLRTRRPEDFEKMVAYVTKLTSEWSLKELGYDITVPDEERIKKQGFYHQGFEVHENTSALPYGAPIFKIYLQEDLIEKLNSNEFQTIKDTLAIKTKDNMKTLI